MQVNSDTGPPPQLKAPAEICIVLRPCTTGEVLKVKSIVALPFDKITEFAGVPLTVKSLASRVAGFTGSLTLTTKSVGGVTTSLPQPEKVTEQGAAVSEATPSRNVMMAMINVVRFTFTFHYHIVIAVWRSKTA